MAMPFVVVPLILALAVAAGAQGAPARGTLTGTVTRGPIAPLCVAEQPCDAPAPNVVLVFLRRGMTTVRTVTNAEGRYRVRLPVGLYTVRRSVVSTAVDRRLEPN